MLLLGTGWRPSVLSILSGHWPLFDLPIVGCGRLGGGFFLQ